MHPPRAFFIRLAAVGAMAACSAAVAQAPATGNRSPADVGAPAREEALSDADRLFLQQAAESVHADMQAARLALLRSKEPAVKDLAQGLVGDHFQAQERLQQLARRKGVTLPPGPSAAQGAQLRELQSASDAEFDRRFQAHMAAEEQRAVVDLYREQAANGSDPQVRRFARQVLPRLEQHLERAQGLPADPADEPAEAPTMRD